MKIESYSIPQLVADLEQVCARFKEDREILNAVGPLARRAALSKDSWLEDRMYHANVAQGFGVYLLHEKPDHTLAVFAVSWLPHRGAPPHDHGTWAVVAGVTGPERNEFFERTDDTSRPGYAEIKKTGEKVFREGDILTMPQGVIHTVWNDTDVVTVSLHMYGKHINYTKRSQFDAERKPERPFIATVEQ